MELNKNMYVRTKDGYIDKIILVEYAEERKQNYPNHPSKNHWRDKILLSKAGYWRTTQNIVKTSYNIIDLIEVGDYVNGYKVEKINQYNVELELVGCFCGEFYSETLEANDIKSILTKEQFEQMKYELK